MATGNRLMIVAMSLVAVACVVGVLWRPSAAAALVPVAMAAINALTPSALRAVGHNSPAEQEETK